MAPHLGEQLVGTGLEGDMEMRLKSGSGGDPVHDFLCQEVGFDARNTVAFDACDAVQRPQQVQEGFARRPPEITRIHTREHDLPDALRRDLLRLADTFGNGYVATLSAGVGDRTVPAVVVASVLHFQERAGAGLRGRIGGENACFVQRPGGFQPQQREGFGDYEPFFFRAEDAADALDLFDFAPTEFRAAARHDDPGIRVEPVHLADQVARLAVGRGGDGTGVDQAYVRRSAPGHDLQARGQETAFVRGRLGKIELAAQGQQRDLHVRRGG